MNMTPSASPQVPPNAVAFQEPLPLSKQCIRTRVELPGMACGWVPDPLQTGCSLRHQIFSLLRTSLKDRPKRPPTANRQLPPTAKRHSPLATNRHQTPPFAGGGHPPVANHSQPPPTTNHQPPTALITTYRQLPTANRHSPPTTYCQPPPAMADCQRFSLEKLRYGPLLFFFRAKDRLNLGIEVSDTKKMLP